jgi:arylsulfatase A-like enzyme
MNSKTVLILLVASLFLLFSCKQRSGKGTTERPNVIFVLTDQWRAQDIGYNGNDQVKTPHLDALAQESVNFTNAISNCPVCSPMRASLLTGQYPLKHGVFYNDKPLSPDITSIADVYKENGYRTAYIGKWHVNGHRKGETTQDGRTAPIPAGRRQGFDFWKVNECTHNYNNSVYFDEHDVKHVWEGYDAIAQTREAINYIQSSGEEPFLLFLSYGPPHAPYLTAPEEYREMYPAGEVELRPNVPEQLQEQARESIAGYYAHITALDDCMKELLDAVHEAGMEDNTILVFTSDHGDMLYSHGMVKKQKPWEESIHVPFLLRYPALLGTGQVTVDMPIGTPDIMPTLLGLSGLGIPESVEGLDYSGHLKGEEDLDVKAALIMCPVPFHQWSYIRGGREYRGVRTRQYTYARDLQGPWLLYDNHADPYQQNNLVDNEDYAGIRQELEAELDRLLAMTGDEFPSGPELMKAWDYDWDNNDDSIPPVQQH